MAHWFSGRSGWGRGRGCFSPLLLQGRELTKQAEAINQGTMSYPHYQRRQIVLRHIHCMCAITSQSSQLLPRLPMYCTYQYYDMANVQGVVASASCGLGSHSNIVDMIERPFITTSETDMCTGNIKAFQTVVWQAHRSEGTTPL